MSFNKFIGVGFIGKKGIELRFSAGTGNAVAKFSLNIPRAYNKGDKKEYDFISCVAFGKSGEFLANNTDKIKRLLVEGHIQTGSYDAKDGTKRYTTDVIVEKTDVIEWNNDVPAESSGNNEGLPESFGKDLTPVDDGDIPF